MNPNALPINRARINRFSPRQNIAARARRPRGRTRKRAESVYRAAAARKNPGKTGGGHRKSAAAFTMQTGFHESRIGVGSGVSGCRNGAPFSPETLCGGVIMGNGVRYIAMEKLRCLRDERECGDEWEMHVLWSGCEGDTGIAQSERIGGGGILE